MITRKNKQLLLIIGVLSMLLIAFYVWLMPLFDVNHHNTGLQILDLRHSYNKNAVIQFFSTIGESGIIQYKTFIFVDFVYLFVYGALAFFFLKFLLNNLERLGIVLQWALWLPALLMILDIIENINILVLLKNNADLPEFNVQFGSAATTLKWISAAVIIGMVMVFALIVIVRNVFIKIRKTLKLII
ncbi:MAG: hypothetical protein Q7U47_08940 [Paludibacter sp.]|nr:hypothetical protein [Paludibacter sp.]